MNPQNHKETISFGALGSVPGVDHLSVRHCSRMWRLYHESYTVCSILPQNVSRTEWAYRGRRYESIRGCLMLMEPGEVHDTKRISGPGSFETLIITPELVKEISRSINMAGAAHFKTANLVNQEVFNVFNLLFKRIACGSEKLEIESRFIDGVSRLLQVNAETSVHFSSSPKQAVLLSARNYIRENFSESISLEELSRLTGLTRFHFLRSFCQAFGLPPHAFQIQVRIAKARQALSKGVRPYDLDLGFSDQSHFIRHFRRSMGVTPTQYALESRRPFSGSNA